MSEYIRQECRFVYADQLLDEDERTLLYYGIQHMSTIYLVIFIVGGGPGPEA